MVVPRIVRIRFGPPVPGRQKSLCASVKLKKLFQEIALVDSLLHAKTTDDSR